MIQPNESYNERVVEFQSDYYAVGHFFYAGERWHFMLYDDTPKVNPNCAICGTDSGNPTYYLNKQVGCENELQYNVAVSTPNVVIVDNVNYKGQPTQSLEARITGNHIDPLQAPWERENPGWFDGQNPFKPVTNGGEAL
jgi:hypothetical protein